ncbi:hypothetical protein ACFL0U_04085 [Pseudomonadota bacterium]
MRWKIQEKKGGKKIGVITYSDGLYYSPNTEIFYLMSNTYGHPLGEALISAIRRSRLKDVIDLVTKDKADLDYVEYYSGGLNILESAIRTARFGKNPDSILILDFLLKQKELDVNSTTGDEGILVWTMQQCWAKQNVDLLAKLIRKGATVDECVKQALIKEHQLQLVTTTAGKPLVIPATKIKGESKKPSPLTTQKTK